MTTVGEFKKKLEGLPETAPLEFWAILEKGLVELVLNPNEGIRFPRESVAEIVLTPAAPRINRDKKNQRPKLSRIF